MRDLRNEYVQSLKYAASQYLDPVTLDKVMADAISLLDAYELSERVTSLIVFDDLNTKLIKTYTANLALDGKSEKTVYAYLRQLKRFCEFLGNMDLKAVTTFDIRNYLASEMARGLSSTTIENTRANLSAFYMWLTNEEYINKNPCTAVKTIKCPQEIKKPFSTVEQDALRKKCETLKERAIVEVLLSSGVRVSELVNLDVSDIDYNNKSVRVRHGKGDKERYTYINDLALNYLVKYLIEAGIESGPLFQNKSKERYTTAGIRYMLNRIANRAHLEDVHPHRFRRTFATTLADRGMDVQDIQVLMGHSDINTTMIYITSDNSKVHNSYRKYIA